MDNIELGYSYLLNMETRHMTKEGRETCETRSQGLEELRNTAKEAVTRDFLLFMFLNRTI